ncbi:hypothetical protein [Nocardia vaccinii]|uniref:hypothetical protein n=1 Tax=Nocardia vaccinii TaxID=1822 RepID=UPI000B132A0A|nr:hypothetical protein [Nocardia vaccinii]
MPTIEQPIRIAEFDRLFADGVLAVHRPGPVRLELALDPVFEPVARDLADRESSCCQFFTFDFLTPEDRVVMVVGVPAAYVEVLDAFAARVDAARGGDR